MPSISQAKLDELVAAADRMQADALASDQRARQAEDRVREFDRILDKVVRAAEGRPLADNPSRLYGGGDYLSPMLETTGMRKLKTVERQEQEIARLYERVAHLHSRLAAAVAVATFAKGHKA